MPRWEEIRKTRRPRIGCIARVGLVESGEANELKLEFLCRGRIDPDLFARMTAMMGGEVTPEREARRKQSETHPDRLDALAAVKAYKDVFSA